MALLAALASTLLSLLTASAALAVSIGDFPATPPQERILDTAGVLSRAAIAELGKTLERFSSDRIDAHLITVGRLDYGLALPQLGAQILEQWQQAGDEPNQLLFLIDSQTNSATVVSSPDLNGQLDPTLLRSTGRTTMTLPIREGGRYRQGSLDAMNRLLSVLDAGMDPGEPVAVEVVSQSTNIPTKEETASSSAFTWIVLLLVAGTLVPMLTWWVFSR